MDESQYGAVVTAADQGESDSNFHLVSITFGISQPKLPHGGWKELQVLS